MSDVPKASQGTPVGRRAVLGMLGLGAAGIVFGKSVQGGISNLLEPITTRDPTGLTGLVPGNAGFRIYAELGSPSVSDADYQLKLDGLVDRPATYTVEQIRSQLPQTNLTRDFQCVTGWRVQDVAWEGVKVADVLDVAGVQANATHLRFSSFDGGYTETLSLEQARRDDVIIAHKMLGKPVTQEHGGPVRLYVAPMYGYKSIKWLDHVEVVAGRNPVGYWEELGYDVDAWVGRSNGRSDVGTS